MNNVSGASDSSIEKTENEIIEEFSLFDNWMSKYEYLIELGKDLPLIEDKFRTEDYKVKGCQSQVWLTAELKDGRIFYKADSDAVITKGMIALLIRVLSGHKPEDVANADLDFINKIGMREHLSPNRSNGLTAMIGYMKKFALNYSGKNV